jgi:hypothetical protein
MLLNFFVRDLQIFIQSKSVCYTRLERFTKDKHSSLLRKSVIYGQKSFITLDQVCKFTMASYAYGLDKMQYSTNLVSTL